MKKKVNKKAFNDEKAMEIVQIVLKMIEEIKNIANVILIEIAQEDEIDKLFIKTSIDKTGLIYTIELFNSETNAIAIKECQIMQTLAECQAGVINQSIELDIKNLYDTSKKKKYGSITRILV